MIKIMDAVKGPVGEWLWKKYIERIEAGYISQAEFARELGISVSLFNNYLNGSRSPSKENVMKLAALGDEVYDLLGLQRPDPILQQLIKIYSGATPKQREEIIRQAYLVIGFGPETE